jgi:hypothetical protein
MVWLINTLLLCIVQTKRILVGKKDKLLLWFFD